MMATESGRVPSGQALAVPVEPVSRLDPAGFDPSRFKPNSYEGKPRHMPKNKRRELDALVEACCSHICGLTPYRKAVLLDAMLSASPVNCSWQHFGLAELFVYEAAALATEAGTAETTEIGSVHEGAGPKDNAQNTDGGQGA